MSATQEILGNMVTEVETRSGKFVRVDTGDHKHYYRVDASGEWHKIPWQKVGIAAKKKFSVRGEYSW